MICDKMNGAHMGSILIVYNTKVKFIMEIDGVEYIRIELHDRFELDIWLVIFYTHYLLKTSGI